VYFRETLALEFVLQVTQLRGAYVGWLHGMARLVVNPMDIIREDRTSESVQWHEEAWNWDMTRIYPQLEKLRIRQRPVASVTFAKWSHTYGQPTPCTSVRLSAVTPPRLSQADHAKQTWPFVHAIEVETGS
jgi:hypothetical protein